MAGRALRAGSDRCGVDRSLDILALKTFGTVQQANVPVVRHQPEAHPFRIVPRFVALALPTPPVRSYALY